MEPSARAKWLARGIAGLIATALILIGGVTWSYSNDLRDRLVAIVDAVPAAPVEIATVGSGRITVARTDQTAAPGIWGVAGDNGYGQASIVLATTNETVERAFRVIEGSFEVGDGVVFDPTAFPGDPMEALGVEFDEIRFTGDLGVYPAWVIGGDRDTWVVVVHGDGPAQRAEGLRLVPALTAGGYPVMITTVRGDEGAPPSRSGLRALGASEWRDLAAAIDYGRKQEAEDFVLVGLGAGAGTVATYLNETDAITDVRGVVFDSALYDPERIADHIAASRGIPGPLRAAGKLLASLRFDLDWQELDQIEHAAEYTVPVLVMHGTDDSLVAISVAEEFAAALGDLATFVEVPGGRHGQLWNANPGPYEDALLRFIESVRNS